MARERKGCEMMGGGRKVCRVRERRPEGSGRATKWWEGRGNERKGCEGRRQDKTGRGAKQWEGGGEQRARAAK